MIGRAVLRAWVLLALALSGAGGARAQNFDFSYRVILVNVTGTFVTTAQGNGSYLITNIINGFRGGNAITLIAPGQGPLGRNDNILQSPANPGYFTSNGFSYSSGGVEYTSFYFSEYQTNFEYDGSARNFTEIRDLAVTAQAPAPHPGGGGLSFLALGLVGLGCYHHRIVGRVRVLCAGLARVRTLRAAPTA